MNTRVVAIAVVSAIALTILVARYDALAQGPRWSQSMAESRARETARVFGIDVGNQEVTATGLLRENLLRFVLRSHPAWKEAFAPVRYAIRTQTFRAEYTPGGQLLRWDCSRCGNRSGDSHPPAYYLNFLAGAHAPEFAARDQSGADGTSRWVWRGAGTSGASLEARVTMEKGRVTSAVLDPDVSSAHAGRGKFTIAAVMHGISVVVNGSALTVAALIAFFRGRKKRPVWRVGAAIACFWIAIFLFGLLLNGSGWPAQERFLASETGTQPEANWVWYHILQQPLLWWLPCAAGMLLIRGAFVERWLGFLHAAESWRPAKRTGQELLDGLLLGWPLALAPYAAGIFGGPVWDVVSPRIGFEIAPSVLGLLRRTPVSGEVVLYFAFLVPLGARLIRSQIWLRIVLASFALGLFGWIGSNLPAKEPFEPVAGILLAIVAIWIYRGHGLLGVFAATWGAAMAAPLAWLLTAPISHALGLITSGAAYAGALAGAVWIRRRGFLGEDADLAVEVARRNEADRGTSVRSERELLRAEFAEAREAQMGMLPERPPVIAGFSVAAVCQPARDVGGDLYDFVEFPDGHWGFCVADVSGKGVPAALYMTMTKGLLASEGRVAGDLSELVLALNEPLYLAGRKKTFVTLVMARLDPKTRLLEMIRAGHNPILWRRAGRNETVYLQPEGLGLGLVSNKLLRRKLQLQTIELEPGDAVVLYSDGLTEAENPRLELFGEDRLLRIVERSDGLSAEELVKEVLAEVEVFKEGADPHDDLTLMVVKVLR
jgi:serine phosphatase RsbU (regulator of sigma subunit)